MLNISDRVLLDLFKVPIKEIGLYAFAYSIGTYFSIAGKSLQQASAPFYMEYYKLESRDGDKKARTLSYIMQAGLLLLAFFICLWMKELFTFIARNEGLKSSYYIAIPIVMAYCYFPSYFYNGMKMWYIENTKSLMMISVGAAVLSVALNLVLIPLFGIIGAAATTFISFMFLGFGGYLYPAIRKEFKVRYYGGVWLIFILLTTLAVFLLRDISPVYKLIITISIFIVFIIAILYRTRILSK